MIRALRSATEAQHELTLYKGIRLTAEGMSIPSSLTLETFSADFSYGCFLGAKTETAQTRTFWVGRKELAIALGRRKGKAVILSFGIDTLEVRSPEEEEGDILGACAPAPEFILEEDFNDPESAVIARYRSCDSAGRLFMKLSDLARNKKDRILLRPEIITATADAIQTPGTMIKTRSISAAAARKIGDLTRNHRYDRGEFIIYAESGYIGVSSMRRHMRLRAPSAGAELVDAEGEAQGVGDQSL